MKMYGLLGLILLLSFNATAAAAETAAVKESDLLSVSLTVPASAEHREYLGLKASGTFTLTDIRARVILIEIFSMYCPYCQREASNVNRLYEAVQADPVLSDAVRMLGIGVGNSAYEVDFFRSTYSIGFPLFADGDFVIHKCLGELRTPYFIGLVNPGNNGLDLFLSKGGELGDLDAFLELLRAGVKKRD